MDKLIKQNIIGNDINIVDYPTPGNLSYFWSFGSLAGLCLVMQIITGLLYASIVLLVLIPRDHLWGSGVFGLVNNLSIKLYAYVDLTVKDYIKGFFTILFIVTSQISDNFIYMVKKKTNKELSIQHREMSIRAGKDMLYKKKTQDCADSARMDVDRIKNDIKSSELELMSLQEAIPANMPGGAGITEDLNTIRVSINIVTHRQDRLNSACAEATKVAAEAQKLADLAKTQSTESLAYLKYFYQNNYVTEELSFANESPSVETRGAAIKRAEAQVVTVKRFYEERAHDGESSKVYINNARVTNTRSAVEILQWQEQLEHSKDLSPEEITRLTARILHEKSEIKQQEAWISDAFQHLRDVDYLMETKSAHLEWAAGFVKTAKAIQFKPQGVSLITETPASVFTDAVSRESSGNLWGLLPLQQDNKWPRRLHPYLAKQTPEVTGLPLQEKTWPKVGKLPIYMEKPALEVPEPVAKVPTASPPLELPLEHQLLPSVTEYVFSAEYLLFGLLVLIYCFVLYMLTVFVLKKEAHLP